MSGGGQTYQMRGQSRQDLVDKEHWAILTSKQMESPTRPTGVSNGGSIWRPGSTFLRVSKASEQFCPISVMKSIHSRAFLQYRATLDIHIE